MNSTKLRVASWNILGRRVAGTHDVAAKGAVAAVVAGLNLDVLCLQEVHFYNGVPDQQLVHELTSVGLRHFEAVSLSESHLDDSARLVGQPHLV